MRRRAPKGMMTQRTLRSMLRSIATELRKKEIAVETKLELLRHEERLSKLLGKVAIDKEKQRHEILHQ